MKRWLIRLTVILLALVLLLVLAGAVLSEPRPTGETGRAADALARKIAESVNLRAWERTQAVKWNFADRYEHLWDRRRQLARVKWDDVEVLLDLTSREGSARRGDQRLEGDEAANALEKAYARWVNDSFWLNPFAKLFDDGVTRSLVTLEEGKEALLVTWGAGGLTPGDAYLITPAPNHRPTTWKMWVSILPIGGIEVTWERYQTLSTGAIVATRHDWALPFELKDVAAADSVEQLVNEDPFKTLGAHPPADAASRPAQTP